MKKLKLVFAIAIISVFALSTNQFQAQESEILVGVGVGYATEINSAAIFAKGVYKINDTWEGSLGVNYFFPKGEGDFEIKWMSFDLDAHYVFSTKDNFDIYGIAGVNIMRVTVPGFDYSYDEEEMSSSSISSTDTGINLGLGGRYQLSDKLFGLGEAKYAVNSGGYLQVSLGVLFQL
jgi:opacity protein-like surface antigen